MGVCEFHQKGLLKNSNYIRAILMIFVVIGHAIAFWNGTWFTAITCTGVNETIALIGRIIGSFHIYGFLFISGYIYAYSKYELGKYFSLKEFFIKKFLRILLPALIAVYLWIMPWDCYFYENSFGEIMKKYFLMESPGQVWFLVVLFWIFIIRWNIDKFLIKIRAANIMIEIVITVIILGIAILGGRYFKEYFQIMKALRHYVYFEAGLVMRRACNLKGGKCVALLTSSRIGQIGTIVCYIATIVIFEYKGINSFLFSLVLNLLGAMSSVFVLNKICCIYKKNKILDAIADNLIGILMFHQQIIMLMLWLFYDKCNMFALIVLNLVVSMGVSIIISKILSRNKYTKYAVGK